MPTYEYVCTACDNHWEEVQKISADALEVCPKCEKSTAKRQISGGNFILKGGGWYADLYSSQPKPKAGGEAKTPDAAPAKSDGASSPSAAGASPSGGAGGTSAASGSAGGGTSGGSSSGSSGSSGGGSGGGGGGGSSGGGSSGGGSSGSTGGGGGSSGPSKSK